MLLCSGGGGDLSPGQMNQLDLWCMALKEKELYGGDPRFCVEHCYEFLAEQWIMHM